MQVKKLMRCVENNEFKVMDKNITNDSDVHNKSKIINELCIEELYSNVEVDNNENNKRK